jgi:hypothetical protein
MLWIGEDAVRGKELLVVQIDGVAGSVKVLPAGGMKREATD